MSNKSDNSDKNLADQPKQKKRLRPLLPAPKTGATFTSFASSRANLPSLYQPREEEVKEEEESTRGETKENNFAEDDQHQRSPSVDGSGGVNNKNDERGSGAEENRWWRDERGGVLEENENDWEPVESRKQKLRRLRSSPPSSPLSLPSRSFAEERGADLDKMSDQELNNIKIKGMQAEITLLKRLLQANINEGRGVQERSERDCRDTRRERGEEGNYTKPPHNNMDLYPYGTEFYQPQRRPSPPLRRPSPTQNAAFADYMNRSAITGAVLRDRRHYQHYNKRPRNGEEEEELDYEGKVTWEDYAEASRY
jgi:hypothetical protein